MGKKHSIAAIVHVFQNETHTRLTGWVAGWIVLFGLLWCGDWAMRMIHFGWHREVFSPRMAEPEKRAASAQAVDKETGQPDSAEVAGGPVETWGGGRRGGLTDFLPSPLLRRPYEEWHEEQQVHRDPEGYAVEPGRGRRKILATVVGDSFLLTGNGHLFSSELEDAAGAGVRNRGRSAAGPFQELRKFIQDVPREQWGAVVVWEIAGREIGASLFLRQPYSFWFQSNRHSVSENEGRSVPSGRVRWDALTPAVLDRRLPNTSAMAYFARKWWSWFRLSVFGEWPPEVLAVQEARFGPTLFYGENLKILPKLTREAQGEGVLSVIEGIAQGFRAAGTELVVLLVPEKEQVWIDDLPAEKRKGIEASADLLRWLEREGRKRGIRVVNPLDAFRHMTQEGIAMYWRDDTHWNGEGMRVAAELTAAELKTIPGWEETAE